MGLMDLYLKLKFHTPEQTTSNPICDGIVFKGSAIYRNGLLRSRGRHLSINREPQ